MKEKSKFNKVMNVVFILIFVCALAYAAYYVAVEKYDLFHTKEKAVQEILAQNQDAEKIVSKKVGEYKAQGIDEPLADWNTNAFQNVLSERGKYIYMHYENEKMEFWNLSKEDMQKKLNTLEPESSLRSAIKDVDEMDEMAVALLTNLGNYDFFRRKDKTEWLLNYTSNDITGLNNLCFDGSEPGKGPQKNIPRLSFDNVKVETNFLSYDYSNLGAIISADVTCDKMTELGKKLDWVPEEGKTKRVTFLLNYFVGNIVELPNTDIICLDNFFPLDI